MARATFTKYGDDDFVLRMDRDNAMRLLAMLGQSSIVDSLLNDDNERPYLQMKGQLSQGQPDFNQSEYKVADRNGEKISTYRIVKS